MTAAVVGLGCCVALLAVLVAGLARRVARLERAATPTVTPARPRRSLVGMPAPDVAGVDPDGHRVAAPGGRVVLAFLTGGCAPCRTFWEAFGEGRRPGAEVVAVTPSPTTESSRAVASLAGGGLPVVMSSEAWLAYETRGAPWFAVVDGGRVVAEGRAESWEELQRLVS